MADVVRFEEAHPGIGFRRGDAAVTIGIHCTPFRGEYRNTVAHCRTGFVTQGLAVCSGIKVQRISDVAVTGDGVIGCYVHVLRPGRRANDDQVIRINLTYGGDNRSRVRFNGAAPGDLQRLVVDFIDNVVAAAIAGGHVLKEADGLSLVSFRMVGVPVDNGVHIVGNGRIDQGYDPGAVCFRIVKIAAIVIDTHCRSYKGGVPIAFQPSHGSCRVKSFAAPSVVTPEEAVSREAFCDSPTEDLVSLDCQFGYGRLSANTCTSEHNGHEKDFFYELHRTYLILCFGSGRGLQGYCKRLTATCRKPHFEQVQMISFHLENAWWQTFWWHR